VWYINTMLLLFTVLWAEVLVESQGSSRSLILAARGPPASRVTSEIIDPARMSIRQIACIAYNDP